MARTAQHQEFFDDGNIFREDDDSGGASSTMAWWGIAGLGAWFDSGYMVSVSSWVLLDGFSIFST